MCTYTQIPLPFFFWVYFLQSGSYKSASYIYGLTALFFLRSRMRDFIFMITRTRDFVCARVIKSVRVIKIIQNESLGFGQKTRNGWG